MVPICFYSWSVLCLCVFLSPSPKCMSLLTVTGVLSGRLTRVLKRSCPPNAESCCFAIVGKAGSTTDTTRSGGTSFQSRELNLECSNTSHRDLWVSGIQVMNDFIRNQLLWQQQKTNN